VEVLSPDTLSGFLSATDPDGIDSLWLVVDTARYGIEGLFLEEVSGPFTVEIPDGKSAGTTIPISLEARDVMQFVATLDTFVRVAFPLGRGDARPGRTAP
jgi:hypothetical protein